MTTVSCFMLLIVGHFIADFALQSHWMASNKSRHVDVLAAHVAVYTVTMAFVAGFILNDRFLLLYFVTITAITHFATDFVTSRLTAGLFQEQDWYNFFVVVGADQLIHYGTLFVTLLWLRGEL